MNRFAQLLSNLRTASLFAICSFIFFAGTAFTQDNPARLGGPAKQSLRDQFSPADYENLLRKQANGELPQQGGAVGTSGTSDVLVNNNTGSTGTSYFTQSETTILAFGSNVVVGFNDAGSNAGGTNRFTGFSYSTDGGVSFTDGGNLPVSGGGDAGDPVMARDETTGRIYFSTLGFAVSTIQMWRSDDNGVTWMAPVNATPGGSSEDKQWHVVDNFAGPGNGNVYLMSRSFGGPNGVYMFRSLDNGATFSTGALIASGAGGNVQGAFVAVGPDHSVYAFWYDDFAANTIKVRKSTDFGVTWSAPVTIVTITSTGVNGDLGLTGIRQGTVSASGFRSSAFPHAAINPVSGNIYVTYADNPAGTDKADVFFVQSTDGGATWSAPVKVNDDATTTDQWQPTIAVTPDGASLGIFYYSRQEDVANNNLFKYYGRTGAISGSTVTFLPSSAVSDVASLPEFGRDGIINTVYMGDYNHAAATPGYFHVVWSDNRDDLAGGGDRKDPNVYYRNVPSGTTSDAPVVNSPIPSGSTSVSGTSTEADGTVIDVFVNSSSVGTTTVTSGAWTKGGLLAAKSGPSVGLVAGDTVKATATASGETESPFSNQVIVKDVTVAPVVNSPIAAGATSVSGTGPESIITKGIGEIKGIPVGTEIEVFVNSASVGTTNVNPGGSWTKPGLAGLVAGDTVKATATTVDKLTSPFSNIVIVQDVTTAPVVTSPITAGATSVSGTGPETIITKGGSPKGPLAGGTIIEVFKNSVSVGTTGVNAGGSWTKSGLAALAAGDTVKAKATAPVKLPSPFSNEVIVQNVSDAPVVNSPILAGATSVSGTSTEAAPASQANGKSVEAPPPATVIEVFVNGSSVGTTTVSGGLWTKSGLAALVAGDLVKATATAFGELPSTFSNVVTVTPANVIVNPGFEAGTSPWVFYTNGTGNLTIVGPGPSSPNAARVAITTTGSNTQLYQFGITLQPSTQYRLTFKAYSNTGHNLSVFLARHDAPYTNYGLNGQIFDITAAWQTYTVDFTTVGFPPPTPSNARLRFAFNGYASAGDQYFIDDVSLEVLGSPLTATKVRVETAPDGGGSVVPAQTIENGDVITMYAISRTASDQFVANVSAIWSLTNITPGVDGGDLVASGDGKSAVFTGDADGSAKVQATSGGLTPVPSGLITVFTPPPATNLLVNGGFESGTTNWTFQTNGAGTFSAVTPGTVGAKAGQISITTQGTTVQLFQQNITLTSGNNYRLSFKAKSTTGHDVQASVFKHASPFTPYGLTNQFFNLTNAWADYTVDFAAGGFGGTVSDARLRLWFAPYDVAGDVYQFDDVRLELLPVPSQPGVNNPQSEIPTEITLGQNFPNPFNPSTTIIYTLPVDARVTLEVYDVLGQRVAQLVDGTITAGYHDAVFDASALSSGLYLYRLTAVGTDGVLFSKTEKMLLTK